MAFFAILASMSIGNIRLGTRKVCPPANCDAIEQMRRLNDDIAQQLELDPCPNVTASSEACPEVSILCFVVLVIVVSLCFSVLLVLFGVAAVVAAAHCTFLSLKNFILRKFISWMNLFIYSQERILTVFLFLRLIIVFSCQFLFYFPTVSRDIISEKLEIVIN